MAAAPLAANIVDGYPWGRSLDMKSGVVMMPARRCAQAAGVTPAYDIILTVLSDEEAGSDFGANFLVDEHAAQFSGVRYAIGEGGGPPMWIGDQKYYSTRISEKQVRWMRATLRFGPSATPPCPCAMAHGRVGQLLTTLNQNRLPVHKTEPVLQMLNALAACACQHPHGHAAAHRRRRPRPGAGRADCRRTAYRQPHGRAAAQHGQRHRSARQRQSQRDPRRGEH
ncbi:MAG: M20/M25/M40 family metallo-hydrolase [Caldilineaceae bacterium]